MIRKIRWNKVNLEGITPYDKPFEVVDRLLTNNKNLPYFADSVSDQRWGADTWNKGNSQIKKSAMREYDRRRSVYPALPMNPNKPKKTKKVYVRKPKPAKFQIKTITKTTKTQVAIIPGTDENGKFTDEKFTVRWNRGSKEFELQNQFGEWETLDLNWIMGDPTDTPSYKYDVLCHLQDLIPFEDI